MTAFQGLALILLAFQLMVSAVEDSSEENEGFLLFLRQHFIPNFFSLEGLDCSHLMSFSFLTTGECKEMNSFIVSFPDILQAVCGSKGKPYYNLRRSLDHFDLITCTLEGEPSKRPCSYNMYRFSASIAVGCDGHGYPVHLEEGDFQTANEEEAEASQTWSNYFFSMFG